MIPSNMQAVEVASSTLVIITSNFSSIVSEYLKSFSTFLGKFYYKWLKNSIIEIGKMA